MFFSLDFVENSLEKCSEIITIQFKAEGSDIPKCLEELRFEKNVIKIEALSMVKGYYSVHTTLVSEQVPAFIEHLNKKYPLKEAYHDKVVAVNLCA